MGQTRCRGLWEAPSCATWGRGAGGGRKGPFPAPQPGPTPPPRPHGATQPQPSRRRGNWGRKRKRKRKSRDTAGARHHQGHRGRAVGCRGGDAGSGGDSSPAGMGETTHPGFGRKGEAKIPSLHPSQPGHPRPPRGVFPLGERSRRTGTRHGPTEPSTAPHSPHPAPHTPHPAPRSPHPRCHLHSPAVPHSVRPTAAIPAAPHGTHRAPHSAHPTAHGPCLTPHPTRGTTLPAPCPPLPGVLPTAGTPSRTAGHHSGVPPAAVPRGPRSEP